ncbi:MAG: lytic transglycosylase domain-containing protein [Bryobacteraceae bacterium]|nr:lytic transglycosylase domain-containing protein [Bryobacteraceae bacterium]
MRHLLSFVVLLAPLCAQSPSPVETLARAGKSKHEALLALAAQHPQDRTGAVALLAAATSASPAEAINLYQKLLPRLPQLRDYLTYFIANSHYEAKSFGEAQRGAENVAAGPGPLAPRAVLLAARAALQLTDYASAIRILEAHRAKAPQPAADRLLAEAAELAGDAPRAANAFRRIFQLYPRSSEAADAEKALTRMGAPLGTTAELFERAKRLIDTGDPNRGARALEAVLPQLTGKEREWASLRIGYADYQARNTPAAYAHLKSLRLESPDNEAERLALLVNLNRRLEKPAEIDALVAELSERFPASPRRGEAMASAGDFYYNSNQQDRAEPMFRSCRAFSVRCSWKAAFADLLNRRSDAFLRLAEHWRRYPESPHASAALYFAARFAENNGDLPTARALYEHTSRTFPNHYYAMLCRRRLEDASVSATAPAAKWVAELNALKWPPVAAPANYEPSAASKSREERASLLSEAALDEYADLELRAGFAEQPAVTAMLMAKFAQHRGAPERGIRLVKSLYPAYFATPLESAPFAFWQMAYPLPWRSNLEQLARERDLDPFIIAGLIRQESEFDAAAVSRSNARGLTQVMPGTGSWLASKLGLGRFSIGMLHLPETNLNLGTYYMRMMLNQLDQNWEFMLAAYNAGKGRVDKWRTWFDYREPAEFVESIPFDETRNYVQVVLRNADFYRRLYAARPGATTPLPVVGAPVSFIGAMTKPAAKRAPVKTTRRKR